VDILDIQAPGAGQSWHSVGSIGFDKDKNLWALHGEFNTGAPAQDAGSNLGKLHRLIPSRQAGMGGAMPAPGNPSASSTVYARGLRSPWRGSYHPGKGWYIIGDVGPGSQEREEVNVLTMAGQNFGWPGGTCNAGSVVCWRPATYPGLTDLDDTYEGRSGRSVWVSPPYGNCGNDRYQDTLTGAVLLGDFFTGWVVGMTFDDAGKKSKDAALGSFTMISSVTQGPDGYLYVTKFGRYHQGAEGENPDNQGLYRVVLVP
jgi:Glucose / Sorbosone dehydrogenase